MLLLTRPKVALATAAVLSLLGAGSLVWAPHQDGPVEWPAVLAQRPLWVPVEGVGVDKLKDSFGAPRSGGRQHKGIDIFAPQGAVVRATAPGKIVGLHLAGKGGIAVYQLDATGKYVYYYAHLNGYAPDLKKGMNVEQGRLIGYVGSTGNAEKTPPHLHFQIQHVIAGQSWWRGPPLNPYPALMAGRVQEAPPVVRAGKSDDSHLASITTGSTSKVRPKNGTKRGTRTYQP
ncbi:MAG: M23 family metallopeptidase [Alphaproteobacteria bacterium]|nr:M23 family metallopeptidase [Alphaproteobacteria bacterium]